MSVSKIPQLNISTTIEDKDWDPLFVVDWKCFRDCPEIVALSPGGLNPDHRDANIEGFKRSVFGGPAERAYAKIFEVHSGDITSFISCRVYRGPKGIIDGDFAKTPPPIQLPQIKDREDRSFYEWYWNSCRETLRSFKELQQPHVFIQALGTDPAWQRHGAATMLMKWILDLIAEEKLGRCALQATPKAISMGFYEKFGFHVIDRREFVDEGRFPGKRGSPVVTMVLDL